MFVGVFIFFFFLTLLHFGPFKVPLWLCKLPSVKSILVVKCFSTVLSSSREGKIQDQTSRKEWKYIIKLMVVVWWVAVHICMCL